MNELKSSIELEDESLRLRTILLAVGGAVMIVRIRSGPNLKEGEPACSDHFVFTVGRQSNLHTFKWHSLQIQQVSLFLIFHNEEH